MDADFEGYSNAKSSGKTLNQSFVNLILMD